jgi:hypothetical protein
MEKKKRKKGGEGEGMMIKTGKKRRGVGRRVLVRTKTNGEVYNGDTCTVCDQIIPQRQSSSSSLGLAPVTSPPHASHARLDMISMAIPRMVFIYYRRPVQPGPRDTQLAEPPPFRSAPVW